MGRTMMRWQTNLLLFWAILFCGCFVPGAYVTKNPGARDQGVRFYRPKPYLRITPSTDVSDDGADTDGLPPSSKYVEMTLVYLPDFSEEYSIRVTPGLGTANATIELEDGWKFTGLVDASFDTKFSENVKAIAGAIPARATASEATRDKALMERKMVVQAVNVPIGYYESVISLGPDGRKRLYGWRYIGFAPISPCPIDMEGQSCADCNSTDGPIFALVFRDGVMVFCPMSEAIDANPVRIEAPHESDSCSETILPLPSSN
jgi:hypothetical protein